MTKYPVTLCLITIITITSFLEEEEQQQQHLCYDWHMYVDTQ